jgi:Cys-tRNA(Pro)/Cys-tRNA(Cys) deacylase
VSEVEMIGPLDIHQYLLAHDIRHEIVRVRRAAPTAAQLPEALSTGADQCVLAHLFVLTDTADTTAGGEKLVLALATADVAAENPGLLSSITSYLAQNPATPSPRLGRRSRRSAPPRVVTLEPAGPELISSRTDYLASQLGPLLLPADVLVVAVPYLAELGTNIVYTATGDGGNALALRAVDLLDASKAQVLGPTDEPETIVLDQPAETATSRLSALASSHRAGATRAQPMSPPVGRRALRSNRASWTPTEQS